MCLIELPLQRIYTCLLKELKEQSLTSKRMASLFSQDVAFTLLPMFSRISSISSQLRHSSLWTWSSQEAAKHFSGALKAKFLQWSGIVAVFSI